MTGIYLLSNDFWKVLFLTIYIYDLISSKSTKDLPEFKALSEHALTASKINDQETIDLKIHQSEKTAYKVVIDTVAYLAAAYEAYYRISSTDRDIMHRYHIYKVISHMDFDTIFSAIPIQ